MKTRHALLAAPALLLAGCQTSAPSPAPKMLAYACDDGRTVQAAYPDPDTAVLTLDKHTYRLHIAIAADGARYAGDQWQWWTKGMHHAWLAPLKPGEAVASASGVSCTAP